RPVRVFSLVSTLRACLRARARQREVAALLARHEADLAEIEQARRRLDFVLETARIGTLSLDARTREVALDARAARFYGLGAGPVVTPIAALAARLHPDDAERTSAAFQRVLAGGGALDVDHRVDGRWIRVLGGSSRDGEGTRVEGVVLDETERHDAATALAESEARYRAVGETLPYGVWVADDDGRALYLSDSFLRLLGTTLAEVRRHGWTHLLPPEEARRVEEAFATARASGLPVDVEFRFGDRVVLTRGSPLPGAEGAGTWVGVHLDVTDRRRMEDELGRIDRLSSVAVLAGGIAHDFNNILGAILANANLARKHIERNDPRAKERVEKVEGAVKHAKLIVGQLLAFARGTAPLRSSLHLRDVLRDAAAFAVQGSACSLDVDIPADLSAVSADGGQIGQVVHNLVLNAVQAQEGGGAVRVRAENVELSAGELPPVPAGRYVRVAVEDDGPGIPAALAERIFEPFVTTKAKGHGLGL
ncbi:MAG: PAS domain S-box protein, partial [Myxococcota bacterium]